MEHRHNESAQVLQIADHPDTNDSSPVESASKMVLSQIDHLVYATPDLHATIHQLKSVTGVQAILGGHHPTWGTRNALISLGKMVYCEIVGPDTGTQAPDRPHPFGIDELGPPRLVTWAAKGTRLEHIADEARRHQIDLGDVLPGSRCRPDNSLLSWKLTDVFKPRLDGLVPFFIDWGETPHPAEGSTQGCSLISLRAEHPDAERVLSTLITLGIGLPVAKGPMPALIATISTPRGMLELR
jgi:hypothetical protein